jgi:uncharacterized radical SAM superfamily Fe-S cluster-containing enzyme
MKKNGKTTAFRAMYSFVKWLRYIKNVIGRIIPENSFLFRQLVLLGLRLTVKQRLAKPAMLNLQIPVTTHCNLNCVCCSAFSTLAKKEFCDVTVYESDLKRIAEITDGKLGFLAFAGGEPLLHPQLTEMFDIARRCFPDALLLIQTNGLLLKKQPEGSTFSAFHYCEYCDRNES